MLAMSAQGEHCFGVLIGAAVFGGSLYALVQGLAWAGRALEWRWLAPDRTAFWLVLLLGPVLLLVLGALVRGAWGSFRTGRLERRIRADGLAALPHLAGEIEAELAAERTFRVERELLPLLAELCDPIAPGELRALREAVARLDRARDPGPLAHGWELHGSSPEKRQAARDAARAALGRVVARALARGDA